MEWYLKALKQYADFSGRARRMEYWMFNLFHILILILLATLGSFAIVGNPFVALAPYFIYALGTIIPSWAVTVRRLHDTDTSGWMILVGVIPLIGPLWLLVLYLSEGTQGPNYYGPDPKAESAFDLIDELGRGIEEEEEYDWARME